VGVELTNGNNSLSICNTNLQEKMCLIYVFQAFTLDVSEYRYTKVNLKGKRSSHLYTATYREIRTATVYIFEVAY